MLGIATSLGVGVLQANAGLSHVLGIESNRWVQTIIILSVVAVAGLSAMAGVEGGVRRLSELNMIGALVLLVALLFMGQTTFLLNAFVQNIGDYLQSIVGKSFNVYV